jgi:hypothetical protein
MSPEERITLLDILLTVSLTNGELALAAKAQQALDGLRWEGYERECREDAWYESQP